MIKVMIADNHFIVREGLKKIFESDKTISIIAEANDGLECLNIIFAKHPDLLIMDFNLPLVNGMEILKKLSLEKNCLTKILIFTGFEEKKYLFDSINYGVDGYILKKSNFRELKNAIKVIMKGDKYFQPELVTFLEKKDDYINNDLNKIQSLTNRELDILKHLSLGMYNKEIALKLDISERTVKNHISNIFKKIGVSDRTQAAVFSIRNYLVDIYK